MDDRSLLSSDPAGLEEAIDYTTIFDTDAGSSENKKKLQIWRRGEKKRIEHIGVSCVPDDPQEPILPRDGWGKLQATIRAIGGLPGSAKVREGLIAAYAKPLWGWAAPLFALPPKQTSHDIMRACLRSGCTWWCRGRWWADRAEIHPVASAVFAAVKAAADQNLVWSEFISHAVAEKFKAIGLELVGYDADKGLGIRAPPNDDCRILAAFLPLSDAQGTLWSASDGAPHAIRAACRIRLLSGATASRLDVEGIHQVDIHAASSTSYVKWRSKLGQEDRRLLVVFRGGASKSLTRGGSAHEECPLCGRKVFPSMRHMWAECSGFALDRRRISREAAVPARWWKNQPRVTAKSGWIVLSAAGCARRRGELLVAASKMGITILRRLGLQLATIEAP